MGMNTMNQLHETLSSSRSTSRTRNSTKKNHTQRARELTVITLSRTYQNTSTTGCKSYVENYCMMKYPVQPITLYYSFILPTANGHSDLLITNKTDPALRSACSRRVTTMWVNRPLQVSHPGQLSLSSSRGR